MSQLLSGGGSAFALSFLSWLSASAMSPLLSFLGLPDCTLGGALLRPRYIPLHHYDSARARDGSDRNGHRNRAGTDLKPLGPGYIKRWLAPRAFTGTRKALSVLSPRTKDTHHEEPASLIHVERWKVYPFTGASLGAWTRSGRPMDGTVVPTSFRGDRSSCTEVNMSINCDFIDMIPQYVDTIDICSGYVVEPRTERHETSSGSALQ